jgi:hypothetical protein
MIIMRIYEQQSSWKHNKMLSEREFKFKSSVNNWRKSTETCEVCKRRKRKTWKAHSKVYDDVVMLHDVSTMPHTYARCYAREMRQKHDQLIVERNKRKTLSHEKTWSNVTFINCLLLNTSSFPLRLFIRSLTLAIAAKLIIAIKCRPTTSLFPIIITFCTLSIANRYIIEAFLLTKIE